MIIDFSIQNFASIKDKQTLSFEAEDTTHLEDYYVIQNGNYRLLKLALIYGANASGKTTILKALDFLRDLVLNPLDKKTTSLDFQPYLFDKKTAHQNTIFALNFIHREVRYEYEVEFNAQAVVREELYFYHPNRANVFRRTTDIQKQLSNISFGSKIKKDKILEKTLIANTLWNNTVLGGFLKTNIELAELKAATDWFSGYLKKMVFTETDLSGYITSLISETEVDKKIVLEILRKADFHISDIVIQKEEGDIPKGFITFLEEKAKVSPEEIDELKQKGKIEVMSLTFEHTVDNQKFSLPFESESQGTKRYYGFAGLLSLLISQSIVFPIDELEASLHPDLFQHFLVSFLVNAKNAQLIATTHNRELLANKDIFRNDAIWITDNSENAATELYALSDFDSTVIRDTSNILNAYKTGKLGGVPNVGDYYIDIQDGKEAQ